VADKASSYVLDSFAVLAYLEGEPGMVRVRTLLTKATKGALALHLSIINLGEILYIVEREQGLAAAQRTLAALDQLPVQVQPADRNVALLAARMKVRYSISYAETDRYWNAIVGNGGKESECGWCKDKWGLSWQITLLALTKAVSDPDRAAAKRAFDAMMQTEKIDIAAIEAALRG
jgi:uncharacterized protein with PIN domain